MKIEKLEYYSSSKGGNIWERHPNIDDITDKINEIIDKLNERNNAEPVIRCKDCIYFHDYGDGVKNCWCDGGGIFTKDDDFCSHAERKDG